MTHRYGLVAPPAIGHLNPMVALGIELQGRGHGVVLFTVADGARRLAGVLLEVVTLGASAFPPGAVDAAYASLGRLSGRQGLRFSVAYFRREQAMLHGELPAALRAAGTAAERLCLPFVTISNALPVNREPAVPPYFTGWLPSPSPWARWRNQLGNALLDRLTEPLWRDLQEQRRSCGLPPRRNKEKALSPLLQLAPHFHYVGRLAMPCGREPLLREAIPFPWERCRTAARSSSPKSPRPVHR